VTPRNDRSQLAGGVPWHLLGLKIPTSMVCDAVCWGRKTWMQVPSRCSQDNLSTRKKNRGESASWEGLKNVVDR
jgi:hypothetical protein